MANQVLRPNGPPFGFYNSAWGVSPASQYWQAIDEIIADGDATYLYSEVENSPFTVRITEYLHSGAGKPGYIAGVLIIATVRVRDVAPAATFKFRMRMFGRDFDSEEYSITNTTYKEVFKWYDYIPNGSAWNSAALRDFEMGLVLVDGGGNQLRCTKMEVHILTDALADVRLEPANVGSSATWLVHPLTSLNYQAVSGVWDGDVTYLESSLNGDIELLTPEVLGSLPITNIEKVRVITAVRTTLETDALLPEAKTLLRIGGVNYEAGTHDLGRIIPFAVEPDLYAWTLIKNEFHGDPSLAWPDGAVGGGPWLLAQINNAEIGLENLEDLYLRCSQIALDLVLHPTPSSAFTLLPISDSAQFHDLPGISPVKAFPNIYENVDDDPPDDATSYIGGDATTTGAPLYATFGVGPGPVIPAGEQVWAVQSSCRIRLGSTASALVGFCVNDRSFELTIAEPDHISGTGVTWFNLYHTWYVNPFSGSKWTAADAQGYEWGIVILEGEAWISQVKVEVLTSPAYTTVSDASLLELTDEADTVINNSITDGTVYEVTHFGIGTGGFNPAIPTTVTAVVKADVALANEVLQRPIDKVTFEDGAPSVVTYWCRVPKSALLGYQVGEVGLYCTIRWSTTLAVDYRFLWAIGHFTGQAIHEDDTILLKLAVNYP